MNSIHHAANSPPICGQWGLKSRLFTDPQPTIPGCE